MDNFLYLTVSHHCSLQWISSFKLSSLSFFTKKHHFLYVFPTFSRQSNRACVWEFKVEIKSAKFVKAKNRKGTHKKEEMGVSWAGTESLSCFNGVLVFMLGGGRGFSQIERVAGVSNYNGGFWERQRERERCLFFCRDWRSRQFTR